MKPDHGRGRRPPRRVRAAAAVAACAAAAAAVIYWPSSSDHLVRVSTAPGHQAPPTASTASQGNGVWEKIAGQARQQTAVLTAQPISAAGVATTSRDAQEALGTAPATGDSSTPVYLVVATGQFTCSRSCFAISGQVLHGTVLGLVFDQTTLSVETMSLGTMPVDLSQLGAVHQLDMAPAPEPPAGPSCTATDLHAAHIKVMPRPTTVAHTLVLRPGPNLQQLSPPGTIPRITASQAWAILTHGAVDTPTADGSVELLLGVLYSQTPATVQNDPGPSTSGNPNTNAHPAYTHTLVWALFSQHQPVAGTGGGPTPAKARVTTAATTPYTTCSFESIVSYIDASSGQLLFSEDFPPGE